MKPLAIAIGIVAGVGILYGMLRFMESTPANQETLKQTRNMVACKHEQLSPLLKHCLRDGVLSFGEANRIRRAYDQIKRDERTESLKDLL